MERSEPTDGGLEEWLDRITAQTREEGEKLRQFGRIGQKVGIYGRSNSPAGEVAGQIIGIDTTMPFDEESIQAWREKAMKMNGALDGRPGSLVKVYVTEGKLKGQVITNLVNSEWRPIEE